MFQTVLSFDQNLLETLENATQIKNNHYIKGYLCYKTIFCHKVALDAKLTNFLFEVKIMFCSRDI